VRNLGLIGGLGPGATLHYYKELSKAQAGEFLIIQADMERVVGHVQRGEVANLALYFAHLIGRMAKGGAEVAAISAVTPHICIQELLKISPLPLVNIVEEVNQEIRSRGYQRVALFGTKYVVESRLYGMLTDVDVLVPDPAQVHQIHEAYMQAVRGSDQGRPVLSQIARQLPVDAVVLAGTDLAPIFDETNTDFPHVDATRVHINALLREIGKTSPARPTTPIHTVQP